MASRHSEIPILDCSAVISSSEDIGTTKEFAAFAESLGDSLRRFGVVYLVNHGLSHPKIENLLKKSQDFFLLPHSVKGKYKKVNGNYHGYTGLEGKLEKELGVRMKESFDSWGRDAHNQDNFPQEVPGLKEAFDEFRSPLVNLGRLILISLAQYLSLENKDFLVEQHQAFMNGVDSQVSSENHIRSNYYLPLDPCSVSGDEMRHKEHCDWSTMTFLYQDAKGGLEAKLPMSDIWTPVYPLQDSIVLNAGFFLEMWSGGHLPAVPHRVRVIKEGCDRARQSIACFVHPDGHVNVLPAAQEKPEWKPLYPKVTYGQTASQYFSNRLISKRDGNTPFY